MLRLSLLLLVAISMCFVVGCSSDDDIVVPPAELYEAHGDFTNFLVGDGSVDTRMNVHLGTSLMVADNISPHETALDEELLLGSELETASIGITLTYGGGAVLNEGEEFSLIRDRRYLFMACGLVSAATGQLKPTLLQLTPLAKPGVGHVQFRFVHTLAGNPIAVDVHVNGEVISNVGYGTVSTAVTFAARPIGQDELLVVPTGVTPDGTNEIWKSTGQLLFVMDEHYDGVLTHHPKSVFDGDINGRPSMKLIQSPY